MKTIINQSDHDLLIELRTEIQNIRTDIKELKDGTASRIDNLEKNKAEKEVVEELQKKVNHDIEVRVSTIEIWMSGRKEWGDNQSSLIKWLIGIGILLVGILIYHLTGYHI